MKKVLLSLLVVFVFGTASAQEIQWMSMTEAMEAQQKEPKKIFMDVYTTWCGPCKLLDRKTFANKDVAAYINENYYPVKFNAEGQEEVKFKGKIFTNPGYVPNKKGRNAPHQFASVMQVSGYPTLAFFDEEGNLIQRLTGFRKPKDLEFFLKVFAEDTHKELNSDEEWLSYSKKFKSEFSN